MKGFIKITAEPTEGGNVTRTEVKLQDVGFADKTYMLNAFLKGLQISPPRSRAASCGYPAWPYPV